MNIFFSFKIVIHNKICKTYFLENLPVLAFFLFQCAEQEPAEMDHLLPLYHGLCDYQQAHARHPGQGNQLVDKSY